MKMEIAKMLLSVVFICLVIFGPCQSTKKYVGEHRELSIIGTQEKDLNIIGGKPFANKATKKQEPKRKKGKRGGIRVKTRRRKSTASLCQIFLCIQREFSYLFLGGMVKRK